MISYKVCPSKIKRNLPFSSSFPSLSLFLTRFTVCFGLFFCFFPIRVLMRDWILNIAARRNMVSCVRCSAQLTRTQKKKKEKQKLRWRIFLFFIDTTNIWRNRTTSHFVYTMRRVSHLCGQTKYLKKWGFASVISRVRCYIVVWQAWKEK